MSVRFIAPEIVVAVVLAGLAGCTTTKASVGSVDAAGVAEPGVNGTDATDSREPDGPGMANATDVLTMVADATTDHPVETVASDGAPCPCSDGSACPCVPYDPNNSAGSYGPLTTSLDCFVGGVWPCCQVRDYEAYIRDPCQGLDPAVGANTYAESRRRIVYPDCNLIGIETTGNDFPVFEWFFDATTKAFVGGQRSSSWTYWDPLFCPSHPNSTFALPELTVQTGITPTCARSTYEQLCPPNLDAGQTEGPETGFNSSD